MDVDCYRLAYNTFHRNWQRFGIPEEDIPLPKTEEVDALNAVIPGFSKVVAFFQITARSALKTYLDECPRVHNLMDFCTRFETIMKTVFPERFVIKDQPKDGKKKVKAEVSVTEDQSENTMETDLSEDTMEDDLSEDSKVESLPEDSKKESQCKNSEKESVPKDGKKVSHSLKKDISADIMETSLSENTTEENLAEDGKNGSLPEESKKESQSEDGRIKAGDVPEIIVFSLAVCTELILYQYEDNKNYMQNLPDLWVKYFNENLKDVCDKAGCNLEMLKTFSEIIRFSDSFLNKFIAENKNEYHNIRTKLDDYIKENYAVESPEHSKYAIEVGCFPKGLCFARMKAQFRGIVESCKCMKGKKAPEEEYLLNDYSPTESS